MFRLIKQVREWPVLVPGEKHTGWLPSGATKPLPTEDREFVLDVKIVDDEGDGFLLISQNQKEAHEYDSWHASLQEAEETALEEFGIGPDDWETVP